MWTAFWNGVATQYCAGFFFAPSGSKGLYRCGRCFGCFRAFQPSSAHGRTCPRVEAEERGSCPSPPPRDWSHSMTCCTLSWSSFPLAWNAMASTFSTALTAQQDPQELWSFTGVTAPCARQSHLRPGVEKVWKGDVAIRQYAKHHYS